MNVNKKPFIKKDAGNVEYNAQVFNTANGNSLAEGAWSLPDNIYKAKYIGQLMKQPIDAKSAKDKLYTVLGDDILYDYLDDAVDEQDVRYEIYLYLKDFIGTAKPNENGITQEILDELQSVVNSFEKPSNNILKENRRNITLEELIDNINVEAPAYRGARMPKFNPNAINESRIPDNMRFKEYDIRIEDNKVNLYWKTQEPFDSEDVKKFTKEIKRAFSTIAKTYDYRDSFTVELLVETRDGREYGYATESFEVNSQVSESWRDGEFTKKDLDSYIKSINDKVNTIKYSLEGMAKKHPEFSEDIIATIEEIRDRFSNIIENKQLN